MRLDKTAPEILFTVRFALNRAPIIVSRPVRHPLRAAAKNIFAT
jgi:hypothetical protein